MPVTFNPNNNYSVDIVTEPDVLNPTVLERSSQTNTPFLTAKITPNNSQTTPVLASNLKIDNKIPEFAWNGSTQQPQACVPPPTPHGSNSSLQHVTGVSIPGTCITGPLGFSDTSFFGTSNQAEQGPYEIQYTFTETSDQIIAHGVGIQNIVLIEVYEDDNGVLVNDNFSPSVQENYNNWSMWVDDSYYGSPASHPITTNIYPVYIKVFVFLSFNPNGLISNTSLSIDVDEVEPVYGCIDPNADNYNASAGINNGSCTYPLADRTITFFDNPVDSTGGYPNAFTSSSYATYGPPANPLRNFRFNAGVPLVLSNTYVAGDFVSELVEIELTPIVPNVGFNAYEAVYDFPIASNPPATNGGPNANIPQTPGYQNNPSDWGDAKNNLTAASIRFLNVDSPTVPYYNVEVNGELQGYGGYSPWHNSPDPTGLQPTMEVFFSDDISTFDPSGNEFILETDGIYLREYYYSVSDPQLILNPGYEFFPYKLKLHIQLDFVMPDYDLNVVLQLDHDTDNQGSNAN